MEDITPEITQKTLCSLKESLQTMTIEFYELESTLYTLIKRPYLPLRYYFYARKRFPLAIRIIELTEPIAQLEPWPANLDRSAMIYFYTLYSRAQRCTEEIEYYFAESREYRNNSNYQEKSIMRKLAAFVNRPIYLYEQNDKGRIKHV